MEGAVGEHRSGLGPCWFHWYVVAIKPVGGIVPVLKVSSFAGLTTGASLPWYLSLSGIYYILVVALTLRNRCERQKGGNTTRGR